MGSLSRHELINSLYASKLLPLFHSSDAASACAVADACFAGGLSLLEFTNRGDFSAETFAILAKHVRSNHPGKALGAGSIIDAYTAALYISMGADFIVGPTFCEEVARLCNRRKILYIPGCSTQNEMIRALDVGAEFIKLFPGDQFGPQYIKALKAPLPQLSFMIAGGVTTDEKSLSEWFAAGASCVGLGSQFISKEFITVSKAGELKEKAARLCSFVSSIG